MFCKIRVYLINIVLFGLVFPINSYASCIGNNYEQGIGQRATLLPTVWFVGISGITHAKETISLLAESTIDITNGGKPAYFWCTQAGTLEPDPRYPDYRGVKYTAPATARTVKISVQVGDGLGYIDMNSVTLEVGETSANTCTPVLAYDNWAATLPSDSVAPDETLTQQWRLRNDSDCDANGYRLAIHPADATFNDAPYDYSAAALSQESFSIPQYERGEVSGVFYAPQDPGVYRIYFDIVNIGRNPLSPLPDGRLWSEFEVTAASAATPTASTGTITGYIYPQNARYAGGQWRVQYYGDGAWHGNAYAEGGYTPSQYLVECSDIDGWIAPQPKIVNVVAGGDAPVSCTYRKPNPLFGPGGELAVTYQAEEDRFYLDYNVSANTDYLEIFASFSGNGNWTKVFSKSIHTIRDGNQPVSINGSQNTNVMYFYLRASNTASDEVFMDDVVSVNYTPVPDFTPEAPDAPALFSLGLETSQAQVTLNWLKIVDSRYQDNVEHYEVQYADNSGFNNATSLNIGNPATGSNIYETISHSVTGLQNHVIYYFRVRAANSVGVSSWSNVESIRIKTQSFPYFNTDFQQPVNGSLDVSKQPRLAWHGADADGDELDYQVLMAPCTENLRSLRSFGSAYVGQDWLDFTAEGVSPLRPATEYCWQVKIKEIGHDNNYYGGEYVKSPLWRFTTENTGPNLQLTKVVRLSDIQPAATVQFRVTAENTGSETAAVRCIEAVYIKSGAESPFRNGTNCLSAPLAPGDTEEVDITPRFAEGIEEYNGQTYDNVLVTGESQIRFQFAIPDGQDISTGNDSILYTVNYQDAGGPVISYFQVLEFGGMYNDTEPFAARMGKTLEVIIVAEDDMEIADVSLDYRLRPQDNWTAVLTQAINRPSLSGDKFEWPIPTDIAPTNEAQVRIVLRDSQGQETVKTSELFPIYSNQLDAGIAAALSSYLTGGELTFAVTFNAQNPVTYMDVDLLCDGNNRQRIYNEVDVQGITPAASYQWTIPANSSLASESCTLELEVHDVVANEHAAVSEAFAIVPTDSDGDGIADDLDGDDDNDQIPDTFEMQYGFLNPNDASDANLDEDGDGRSNLQEFLQGTDPGTFDTVSPPSVRVDQTAACDTHSVFLTENGKVYTAGNNTDGKLGDGTTLGKSYPVLVTALDNAAEIACGDNFTLALSTDGTVWSWGANRDGQLGIGSFEGQLLPVQINALSNVRHIAAGGYHALAVLADGRVFAWGMNSSLQAGISDGSDQAVPVQVSGISNAVSVDGGHSYSLALLNDGSVAAWGKNSSNQLGNGTHIKSAVPVRVPGITDVVQVSAGRVTAAALHGDGTVSAWGGNMNCQLGIGDCWDTDAIVKVPGLTGITKVAIGGSHSSALKSDGTLMVWGQSWTGVYGNGNASISTTPIPAAGFTDITDVSGGRYHILLSREDGSLWASGSNYGGQLGDGTLEGRLSPVKIELSAAVAQPVATITATVEELTVLLDCTDSSVAAGAMINRCTWSASDGQVAIGMQSSITFVQPGSYLIELNLADSYGQTALASETFEVSLADRDGDGVIDGEDAFPEDATEWLDTDGDNTGNNADTDDDGDGIPDLYEIGYSFLDALNADDAQEDADADGLSNLEEYLQGSDPSVPEQTGTEDPETVMLTLSKEGGAIAVLNVIQDGQTIYRCKKAEQLVCSVELPFGAAVRVKARSATGFIFDSWGNDCQGTRNRFDLTMDSDKACSAKFSLDPAVIWQNLTVQADEGGTIAANQLGRDCGQNCTAYVEGLTVRLTAVPETGYVFVRWEDDCSETAKRVTVTMDSEKRCSAVFEAYKALTALASGEGSITPNRTGEACGLNCTAYPPGRNVRLLAEAAPGWRLIGWSGACNGTRKRVTVAADAAKTCIANFVPEDAGSREIAVKKMAADFYANASLDTGTRISYASSEAYAAIEEAMNFLLPVMTLADLQVDAVEPSQFYPEHLVGVSFYSVPAGMYTNSINVQPEYYIEAGFREDMQEPMPPVLIYYGDPAVIDVNNYPDGFIWVSRNMLSPWSSWE